MIVSLDQEQIDELRTRMTDLQHDRLLAEEATNDPGVFLRLKARNSNETCRCPEPVGALGP